MKPARPRASPAFCAHASQMSERRNSFPASNKIVRYGCWSANGWAHASQACARDWMFHSFMGGESLHEFHELARLKIGPGKLAARRRNRIGAAPAEDPGS